MLLTTELLENILKFLPMRDLLLVQRVSRKWSAVITQSTLLQQMLFFAPKQTEFRWECEVKHEGPRRKWPRKVDRTYVLPEVRPKGVARLILMDNGQLNPLLFSCVENIWEKDGDESYILALPRFNSLHLALSYPEASWRRMLVSQPPVDYCVILDRTSIGSRSEVEIGDGTWDHGGYLTCQDLWDTIYAYYLHQGFITLYEMGVVCPSDDDLAKMLAEQDVMVD